MMPSHGFGKRGIIRSESYLIQGSKGTTACNFEKNRQYYRRLVRLSVSHLERLSINWYNENSFGLGLIPKWMCD